MIKFLILWFLALPLLVYIRLHTFDKTLSGYCGDGRKDTSLIIVIKKLEQVLENVADKE